MSEIIKDYDVAVIGSGMGGMTAASMLTSAGFKVVVLEAASVPGGCSSSYYRKGYTFESGATTLIGFDKNQPLRFLEDHLDIEIPKEEIQPSMNIWLNGKRLIRYKDREKWIEEVGQFFGSPKQQKKFWELAFRVSDVVWKASLKNSFFPPQNLGDWIKMAFNNSPADVWILKYAFKSVEDVMNKLGVNTPDFKKFVDEQLMITAQSKSEDTPFIFGAPGITYTNYSNYYVPGGLIEMVNALKSYLNENGSIIKTKRRVEGIQYANGSYTLITSKESYEVPIVVSNIPIWNLAEISDENMSSYFERESKRYEKAWGAVTMGIATNDSYPEHIALHHQIHVDGKIPHTNSDSFFVSMSSRQDAERTQNGDRVLNISCHADPEYWFSLNGDYDAAKSETEAFIIDALKEKFPGFKEAEIKIQDTATPVSWEKWVYRKKGRVGGIPQSMARSLLDWTPNVIPFKGFYLCGDTVYPGQGIPGVTLSGINVYYRILSNHKAV